MANEEIHQIITHQFYSLKRPDWMINAGLDKGVGHDRVNLRYILLPGTKIRFRQTSPASNVGVRLNLLNDDSKTESHAQITTQWTELVASVASVAFVETRYTDEAGELTEVEVEFDGAKKVLPISVSGALDDLFFSGWDSQDAEYALFSSTYANILIPKKDKEVLRRLKPLRTLAGYYDGIFEYFNHLSGLSFQSALPTDKNIANRYFIKADKSGAGAGYYGGGWTAETSDSVAAFWLDIKATNWGSLHEIAHGYQGGFMRHTTINLGEVWNNVLAAKYQYKFLGEAVYRDGWLYSGGEEQLYAKAKAAFDAGTIGSDLALTLFFLMLIFDRAGEQSLVEFYRRFRQVSNESGFRGENYPAMDFLSHIAIEVGNVDVSAFMSLAKATVTALQLVENAYSNTVGVYPLYWLVTRSNVDQVRQQLGLRSSLQLVGTDSLSAIGMKGDVSFRFDPDVFNKVVGKVLVLRNGNHKARIVEVDVQQVYVRDLPVGVYQLQLPSDADGAYQGVSNYLVVREVYNAFDCTYVKKIASVFADQKIYLGGLYGDFCVVTVDVSQGRLKFEVLSESPHSYFGGVVYAEVTIRDQRGGVVFNRKMLGDQTALFSLDIAIAIDFTIEIMHLEPSRLKVLNSTASAVVDGTRQINRLKVLARGLTNTDTGTDVGENLIQSLGRASEIFERSPHLVLYDETLLKEDFKRAINSYAQPIRGELFERFKNIEFVPPAVSGSVNGQYVSWALSGNGGTPVGSIAFNLISGSATFVFHNVFPHHYFPSVYIAVVLKSANGDIRYIRELRGDMAAEAESVEFSLALGDTVSVMHREPERSVMEHDGRKLAIGLVQHAIYDARYNLSLASYWPTTTGES